MSASLGVWSPARVIVLCDQPSYLKQFTETRINGQSTPGTEEQTAGIGPGMVLNASKNINFFLNLYFETAVENRPCGTRLNAVFALHF